MLDLAEIKVALDHFDATFHEVKNDRDDFEDDICNIYEMDLAAYQEFLQRRATTPYGQRFARFRDFMPTVLDTYASGSGEDREAILDLFDAHPFAQLKLVGLIDECLEYLKRVPDDACAAIIRKVLRLAILLDDCLVGHEIGGRLSLVWYVAEDVGLDPVAVFREAADLAVKKKRFRSQPWLADHVPRETWSADEVLREFEPCLRDHIYYS